MSMAICARFENNPPTTAYFVSRAQDEPHLSFSKYLKSCPQRPRSKVTTHDTPHSIPMICVISRCQIFFSISKQVKHIMLLYAGIAVMSADQNPSVKPLQTLWPHGEGQPVQMWLVSSKGKLVLQDPYTVTWYSVVGYFSYLTHPGRDNMVANLQTTFSNEFSWIKSVAFQLKFHWNLFPMVQLTINQHWLW